MLLTSVSSSSKKTRPRVLRKIKDNLEDEACNEGVIDLATFLETQKYQNFNFFLFFSMALLKIVDL